MSGQSKAYLTMEERLGLAAKSQASSPEAAARLVERLSGTSIATLLAGTADRDLLYDLTGNYWDLPAKDFLHYSGFCRIFQMAIESDFEPPADYHCPTDPIRPALGTRSTNALVLLGLMMLDHAKGRRTDKTIYHCTRMTLGQYLDALETLAFPEKDTPPAQRFEIWRSALLQGYDRSLPLADVLADILRSYIAGWQEFDHLDYILRCTGAMACYLEEMAGDPLPPEEAERVRQFREMLLYRCGPGLEGRELPDADKHYRDPAGYFFGMAYEYPDDVPDPGGKGIPARAIRSRIYLPDRDCDPGALQTLAGLAPSPDLGSLLRIYGSPERLTSAMAKIDTAVFSLYMLWVDPYLQMEARRSEAGAERKGPLG